MAEILNMDALEALKTLPSESVHCIVTSPPYYGLRDYGVEGQIGLEETPEKYIAKLVEIFREAKRVLKAEGTLWINIGDSYAGSGKGAWKNKNAQKEVYVPDPDSPQIKMKKSFEGIKPKDLIGIPWMLAFALRADGWYLRQDIVWAKPNSMPESVRDRCTKSHEYIFLLSKSPKYFFDAEAISEPIAASSAKRYAQNIAAQKGSTRAVNKTNAPMKAALPRYGGSKYTELKNYPDSDKFRTKSGGIYNPTPRRNKRDVWTVSTKPFKGAHFAVFPPDLVEPCILAGCPEGEIVLDPFAGSGTTGVVALAHNREFVGIEINSEYCELARNRIEVQTKMF